MKSNKERTIKACKIIANEYLTIGHVRMTNNCALCKIHYINSPKISCRGCPMANIFEREGCTLMKTYIINNNSTTNAISQVKYVECKYRGLFYLKVIKILEQIDSKYFTKKGWKHEAFKSIRRLDILIANLSLYKITIVLQNKSK